MLTPQEVSSHAFPKAVVGGYNMSSVDEFLDELTDDYTALYKENTALKAKMKVLVEKVEDYRSTEDSMRATLLTAQKMADSIVREAESRRGELMAQAESDARARLEDLQDEVAAAEQRLLRGQQVLSDFISSSRALCSQELRYLDQLPALPVQPSPAASPAQASAAFAVGEIEQRVMEHFSDAPQAAPEPEIPAPEEELSAEEPTEEPQAQSYPEENPFAQSGDGDATRRINLKDLKFGRNYSGGSD